MINTLKSMLPEKIKQMIFEMKRRNTAVHVNASASKNDVLNCLIAYNKYGAYCTPLASQQRSAIQILLRGEVYEPYTIEFMSKNAGDGDIIHAGTFFGDFLPALSTGIASDAKIWAFEPNRENYRCAKITISLNELKNIELKNAGLGEQNSMAKMLVKSEDGVNLGGSSKIIEKAEAGTTQDIEVNSIDDVIPEDRKISIIQLDVEGYEQQALAGAIATIRRCKPILILEDNNGIINTDWFKNNISNLGYLKTEMVHNNTVLSYKA